MKHSTRAVGWLAWLALLSGALPCAAKVDCPWSASADAPYLCIFDQPVGVYDLDGTHDLEDTLANVSEVQEGFVLAIVFTNTQNRYSLPESIARFAEARALVLNGANSTVPSSFGTLTKLVYLDLSEAVGVGSLPSQLGALSGMQRLLLQRMLGVEGAIPSQLFSLPQLQYMDISYSQFSGTIPPEVGAMRQLQMLRTEKTQLRGTVPAQIGRLESLREMQMKDGLLEGPLPSEIGNLTSLQVLQLSYNLLHGPLPTELGVMASLDTLSLTNNSFYGTLPEELGNLSSLKWLELTNNDLGGTIPTTLGLLTNLALLDLGDNKLHGPLPLELRRLTALMILSVPHNHLQGTLKDLANERWPSLYRVIIKDNDFSGKVDKRLWRSNCLDSGLENSECRRACECAINDGRLLLRKGDAKCRGQKCVHVAFLAIAPAVVVVFVLVTYVRSQLQQASSPEPERDDRASVQPQVLGVLAATPSRVPAPARQVEHRSGTGRSYGKAILVALGAALDVFQLELSAFALVTDEAYLIPYVCATVAEFIVAGMIVRRFGRNVAPVWKSEALIVVLAPRVMAAVFSGAKKRKYGRDAERGKRLANFQFFVALFKLTFNMVAFVIQLAFFLHGNEFQPLPSIAVGLAATACFVSATMALIYHAKRALLRGGDRVRDLFEESREKYAGLVGPRAN